MDHGAGLRPTGVDPSISAEDFKSIFRRHPAGVAVIAFAEAGRPVGFTATSVISVSAEPPMLAFSVAGTSTARQLLERAGSLTVNLLAADQVEVAARFATRGIDRFAGVDWSALPTGEPVLTEALSWMRGEVVQRTPVGSSVLVVLRVVQSGPQRAGAPLVYYDRSYHQVDEGTAI